MKKSLLLLVAGAIAITAGAQERQVSTTSQPVNVTNHFMGKKVSPSEVKSAVYPLLNNKGTNAAERTTFTGGRWYFYGDILDSVQFYNSAGTYNISEPLCPWVNGTAVDTFGYFVTSTGNEYINMASVGIMLNPWDSNFNYCQSYVGSMKLESTNAYAVDSVELIGLYDINPSDTNIVDTIRLTYSYGTYTGSGSSSGPILNGGLATSAGFEYSGASFPSLFFDSVTNISDNDYSAPTNKQDIILNNHSGNYTSTYSATNGGIWTMEGGALKNALPAGYPAWADTAMPPDQAIWAIRLPLSNSLSVGAGQIVGVSLSFFSGKPSPPALTGVGVGGGVIENDVTNTVSVSNFLPLIHYASDGSTSTETAEWVNYNGNVTSAATATYAYYAAGYPHYNQNTGLYKELPNWGNDWEESYLPNWTFFTQGATPGPSQLQYPFISLYITCSSCGTIVIPPNLEGVNNTQSLINSINAYPNPTNNTLNIAFNLNQAAPVTVTLTNMVGEVVATMDMGNTAKGNAVFNTANLAEGIYIYTLSANGVSSTGHVAVMH